MRKFQLMLCVLLSAVAVTACTNEEDPRAVTFDTVYASVEEKTAISLGMAQSEVEAMQKGDIDIGMSEESAATMGDLFFVDEGLAVTFTDAVVSSIFVLPGSTWQLGSSLGVASPAADLVKISGEPLVNNVYFLDGEGKMITTEDGLDKASYCFWYEEDAEVITNMTIMTYEQYRSEYPQVRKNRLAYDALFNMETGAILALGMQRETVDALFQESSQDDYYEYDDGQVAVNYVSDTVHSINVKNDRWCGRYGLTIQASSKLFTTLWGEAVSSGTSLKLYFVRDYDLVTSEEGINEAMSCVGILVEDEEVPANISLQTMEFIMRLSETVQ